MGRKEVWGWRPSGGGAALGQGDADALKRFDHFIRRLGTEVLDLQQILVAEAHQIRL